MTQTVKEYTVSAAASLDIPIDTDFPSASVLDFYFRFHTPGAASKVLALRVDAGSGIATANYEWSYNRQASIDATPTYESETSAETSTAVIRFSNSWNWSTAADSQWSGTFSLVGHTTTGTHKQIEFQTAYSGSGVGTVFTAGTGAYTGATTAIDTIRFILNDAVTTFSGFVLVVGTSE